MSHVLLKPYDGTGLPWTPERLLERAVLIESALSDPSLSVSGYDRFSARQAIRVALGCAAWLEANGPDGGLMSVGPFAQHRFERKQIVYIQRGARVFGTGSAIPREGIVLARRQKVWIHHVNAGYWQSNPDEVFNPRVSWVGAGGYWRWTDVNHVESSDAQEECVVAAEPALASAHA